MATKGDLLNIDGNPKTVKGQKQGYMTAILYLAPWKLSGRNVCAMAEEAGCFEGCLFSAGHGGIGTDIVAPHGVPMIDNVVTRARMARTELFHNDRAAFLLKLEAEIVRFVKKAERKGLTPVVRLNGTSDIPWEDIVFAFEGLHGREATIFVRFPSLIFYDYTKVYKRVYQPLPPNYTLVLSYSEASSRYARRVMQAWSMTGAPVVIVMRDEQQKQWELEHGDWCDMAVDGDEHDLVFLHPERAIIYLRAKGAAAKDTSGFVMDNTESQHGQLTSNG